MRIAVTSQNFRTITGHAGKTRRFLIYEAGATGDTREVERLDLPREMSLHEYHGNRHPIYDVDAVITAGCGAGFVRRLAQHDVRVIATAETTPQRAAELFAKGEPLAPAAPHEHGHPAQAKIDISQ